MPKQLRALIRWLPAVTVMALIFVSSSIPSPDLPNLGPLDVLFKKTGHVLAYGVLAIALWFGLGWRWDSRRLAWMLAVLYAATDEIHQFFTPGRHAWWLDVVFFDALGAMLGLWLAGRVLVWLSYSNSSSNSSSSPQSSRRSM